MTGKDKTCSENCMMFRKCIQEKGLADDVNRDGLLWKYKNVYKTK